MQALLLKTDKTEDEKNLEIGAIYLFFSLYFR